MDHELKNLTGTVVLAGAGKMGGAMLSGCAVGPDYDRAFVTLPTKWGNAKAPSPKAVTLAHWWNRLGDPTLNALLEEAVQCNLDVASAKARIREAGATRRQATGAELPTVKGVGAAA